MSWCEAGCRAECQVEGERELEGNTWLAKRKKLQDQNRTKRELKNETVIEGRGGEGMRRNGRRWFIYFFQTFFKVYVVLPHVWGLKL